VKKAGLVVAALACSPFLLAVPVVFAANEAVSASCQSSAGQSVDAADVAAQVEDILGSGSDDEVSVPGLSSPAEQIPNARVVTATGIAMQIPARGQVVALATALQESGLRNLTYGDRDSVGLFQQRPSRGWGTVQEILDPAYASTKFYEGLRKVSGWESMTVTQAAQAVQRSGFPDAYAKWEPLATALQEALAPGLDNGEHADQIGSAVAFESCSSEDGSRFGEIPAGALPDGYTVPADAPTTARTAIRWALEQLDTPYQWGGSCTDAHGPDPMGRCDCSSLMQQSYRAAGVTLARTTYGQVKEGRAVSVDALRPGDLLFTEGSASAPEHVGMYIGEDLVIHAPRTGDVVRIVTLKSWKSDVLAARRVI
jgi:cell wall-associated NlpC family hydrolase